jgi:hypothetical protein
MRFTPGACRAPLVAGIELTCLFKELASYRKRFNELRHRAMRMFAGFDSDFMYGRWADLSPE